MESQVVFACKKRYSWISLSESEDIGRTEYGMSKSPIHCKSTLLIAALMWSSMWGLATGPDRILVLLPDNVYFHEAFKGLETSVGTTCSLYQLFVNEEIEPGRFEKGFKEVDPNLLVIMNNQSVRLYREYQRKHPDRSFPPAIVIMAVYAQQEISSLKNATGIEYEITADQSLSQLRELSGVPLRSVGVVYRSAMENYFNAQEKLCQQEDLILMGYRIDSPPSQPKKLERDIKNGLDYLIRQKIDALWILNDSILLGRDLLRSAWFPRLKNFRRPVIVGVERFVLGINLGHFAVYPDHFSLGRQAAELVIQIRDNSWQLEGPKVHAPRHTMQILDYRHLDPELRKGMNLFEGTPLGRRGY